MTKPVTAHQPPAEEAAQRRPRRSFLAKGLAVLGGAAVAGARAHGTEAADTPGAAPSALPAKALDGPDVLAEGNTLERMRVELLRALNKPPAERKWVMVIDLHKCIGCGACTASCAAENNLPPGVVYRPVPKEEVGEYPHVRKRFLPRPCMHCDEPPCVPPCPVGATFKRPDGIVSIDYDQCIGCRYCITACPYGARYFDFGEYHGTGTPEVMDYETRPVAEYGQARRRTLEHPQRSPSGNARKCHYCLHRIESGMLPACVTTCLGGATFFGDYHDQESLVHQLVGSSRMMRLLEELGTHPKTYYLV